MNTILTAYDVLNARWLAAQTNIEANAVRLVQNISYNIEMSSAHHATEFNKNRHAYQAIKNELIDIWYGMVREFEPITVVQTVQPYILKSDNHKFLRHLLDVNLFWLARPDTKSPEYPKFLKDMKLYAERISMEG